MKCKKKKQSKKRKIKRNKTNKNKKKSKKKLKKNNKHIMFEIAGFRFKVVSSRRKNGSEGRGIDLRVEEKRINFLISHRIMTQFPRSENRISRRGTRLDLDLFSRLR